MRKYKAAEQKSGILEKRAWCFGAPEKYAEEKKRGNVGGSVGKYAGKGLYVCVVTKNKAVA